MARRLTKLVVNEISLVDRGAGEGVKVLYSKRAPRNRFEQMFRQIDFSKMKINQDPDDSLSSTTKSQREDAMMTSRADQLRDIAKDFGVHKLAKMLVTQNDAHGITEHELTALAFEEAQKSAKPGERPNSTFARWYGEPEQLELRKAIQIAKNTPVDKAYPPLMDMKPTQVSGAAAMNVNDASEAYNKLTAMAEALRAKSPTLTAAQAFAKVFEDPANAELAAKAHRRPTPTTSYAMP